MNMRAMMFTVAFFLSSVPITSMAEYKFNTQKKLYSSYAASYILSLVLSGCVGVTTGSTIRYVERKYDFESSTLLLFLGWMVEYEIRNNIITYLQKDFDMYKVKYKKESMFTIGWIASWLAYLYKNDIISRDIFLHN
ncbi:MAG TPA: hypothetical protein VLB80_01110 [Candidatus Babeliales bacterium]|nr:hypothetical protein [Candidatus Babeliales bacterium]